MKTFFLIGGIVIVFGGLVLLLATPTGIVFIIAGIAFIIYSRKYKPKPKQEKTIPTPPPAYETLELNVAGFDYFQRELKELLNEENEDYTLSKKQFLENVFEKCYQYEIEYYPARLEREDNEYDPNAIAVYVDDVKIGYVARKDQKLIDFDRIIKVEATIYGGKYKEPSIEEYDEVILKGETPYKALLTIDMKKEQTN